MAKTKRKNSSEVEHLRGYVRELESMVRSLKKELRRFEKYEKHSQEDERVMDSEDTFPDLEFKHTKDCEVCGKGKIIETLEILGKVYGKCNVCETNDRIK